MPPDPPKHMSRFSIMLGVTGKAAPSGMMGEQKKNSHCIFWCNLKETSWLT